MFGSSTWPTLGAAPTAINSHAWEISRDISSVEQCIRARSSGPQARAIPFDVVSSLLDSVKLFLDKLDSQLNPTVSVEKATPEDLITFMGDVELGRRSDHAGRGHEDSTTPVVVDPGTLPDTAPEDGASIAEEVKTAECPPEVESWAWTDQRTTSINDVLTDIKACSIHVRLHDPALSEQHTRGQTSEANLVQAVNERLKQDDFTGRDIRILSARFLCNGDPVIRVGSEEQAAVLKSDRLEKNWVKVIGPRAAVSHTLFGFLIHGIRIVHSDTSSGSTDAASRRDWTIERIRKQFSAKHAQWLYKPSKQTKNVTLRVHMSRPDHANHFIRKGSVSIDGTICQVERDCYGEMLDQCRRCFAYGHAEAFCLRVPICGRCGEEQHKSHTCPNPTKCYHCQGSHPAWALFCPERAAVRRKAADVAKEESQRQPYWPSFPSGSSKSSSKWSTTIPDVGPLQSPTPPSSTEQSEWTFPKEESHGACSPTVLREDDAEIFW